MELIIDFYKSLDVLNIIIFWGIIIVIILLLIFSCILITKNKKLKRIVESNNNQYEEELPIKNEIQINENIKQLSSEDDTILIHSQEEFQEQSVDNSKESKSIEIEQNFIVEEHVIGYNKNELTTLVENASVQHQTKQKHTPDIKTTLELPTAPYQKNVLREMSLSQTSPIGINRQENTFKQKEELAKDLEESLNIEESTKELTDNINNVDNQIKKDLINITNSIPRKTEIINNTVKNTDNMNSTKTNIIKETQNTPHVSPDDEKTISNIQENYYKTNNNQYSNTYLEEVSRKLAEAEVPNEIERTNYELKQEEDAIISYKELMEKKDSIQTIDEEDAIISIEELMNLSNNQLQSEAEDTRKLYHLTEEEENENFIKELKQFRKDL